LSLLLIWLREWHPCGDIPDLLASWSVILPCLAGFVPTSDAYAVECFDGAAEHSKFELAGLICASHEDMSFGLAVALDDGGPLIVHSILKTLPFEVSWLLVDLEGEF